MTNSKRYNLYLEEAKKHNYNEFVFLAPAAIFVVKQAVSFAIYYALEKFLQYLFKKLDQEDQQSLIKIKDLIVNYKFENEIVQIFFNGFIKIISLLLPDITGEDDKEDEEEDEEEDDED